MLDATGLEKLAVKSYVVQGIIAYVMENITFTSFVRVKIDYNEARNPCL